MAKKMPRLPKVHTLLDDSKNPPLGRFYCDRSQEGGPRTRSRLFKITSTRLERSVFGGYNITYTVNLYNEKTGKYEGRDTINQEEMTFGEGWVRGCIRVSESELPEKLRTP